MGGVRLYFYNVSLYLVVTNKLLLCIITCAILFLAIYTMFYYTYNYIYIYTIRMGVYVQIPTPILDMRITQHDTTQQGCTPCTNREWVWSSYTMGLSISSSCCDAHFFPPLSSPCPSSSCPSSSWSLVPSDLGSEVGRRVYSTGSLLQEQVGGAGGWSRWVEQVGGAGGWPAKDTATVSEGHTPAYTLATAHHITPHRITSQHNTSQHTTARHITSQQITSHHSTSHHSTAHLRTA